MFQPTPHLDHGRTRVTGRLETATERLEAVLRSAVVVESEAVVLWRGAAWLQAVVGVMVVAG